MRSTAAKLLIGLGAGVLVLAISRAASATVRVPISKTPENVEWLARVLMVEQSASGREPPWDEWAGIAWVAINRAAKLNASIREVLLRESYPVWFGASPPDRLYADDLLLKGNGPKALTFADRVLDGQVENPIGVRISFVHPKGLARCEQAGVLESRRICVMTSAGLRWLPVWAVSKDDGGVAKLDPMQHGAAVFAECVEL